MRFYNYLNEQDDLYHMVELCAFMDNDLNESSLADKFETVLKPLGLKVSKKKGLLSVLKDISKNTSLLLYYGIKAHMGDEKSKEKVKEYATKVKKEDFMELLFKLDMLTLHLITGPIHMIDALTGWHVAPDIKTKSKELQMRAKKVLDHLKAIKDEVKGPKKKKIETYFNNLYTLFKKSFSLKKD